MTAGILNSVGVFTGTTKEGDEYNQRGYYEHVEIDMALSYYLRSCDADGLGKRFQPIDLDEQFVDFRDLVLDIIESERPGSPAWAFKSTKTAICRNIWRVHFPTAKWIICRRKRDLIIDSMVRSPFMDAYNTRDEWDQMLNRYEYMMRDIADRCDAYEFDVDSAVNGDVDQVAGMLDFIGHDADANQAHKFIDRRLIRA